MVSIEYPRFLDREDPELPVCRVCARTHSLDNTLRMTPHVDQTSPTCKWLRCTCCSMKRPNRSRRYLHLYFADKPSRTYAYSSESFIKRPMSASSEVITSVRDWIVVLTNAERTRWFRCWWWVSIFFINTWCVDIDDAWKFFLWLNMLYLIPIQICVVSE
jgi:hypothetical protein